MISIRKVLVTGMAAALVAAAVIIAGCMSTSSPNTQQLPTANAGADQKGKVGTLITLDGTKSSAPDDSALTYNWAFSAVPTNSTARLADQMSDRPTFTPDKAGMYVLSLTVTDSAGVKSAPATTNVTAVPAEPMNTTITDIHASKTDDLYLGDQVVMTGRLVDANGNGIPNQTVEFKAIAHVLGFTQDASAGSATTDSTGTFRKVNDPVSADGAPSFIKTVDVEGWIEYAGNDLYKPTSTPHRDVTVHLTSPPSS